MESQMQDPPLQKIQEIRESDSGTEETVEKMDAQVKEIV